MFPHLTPAPALKTAMENSSPGRFVTSDGIKYAPGVASCVGRFNLSGGVPSLVWGENISGVTDHGVGDFSAVFSANMGSTTYAMVGIAANALIVQNNSSAAPAVGSCRFGVFNTSGVAQDPAHFSIAIFGGLA